MVVPTDTVGRLVAIKGRGIGAGLQETGERGVGINASAGRTVSQTMTQTLDAGGTVDVRASAAAAADLGGKKPPSTCCQGWLGK